MDIAIPEVFIGGLLGATLVFLFSAWACVAVGVSAQAVVTEVCALFILPFVARYRACGPGMHWVICRCL